jgi:nitrogen fixation/metabolism regulation signal transduction histidine kinase
LLLLIVVIMVTALFLSNALAQPIARLRAGLEAVGEGRYARRLPVDTRDEIGELVQTFNEMREQLAESRRRLSQQERELAWREMARQVAHEIKNPLTPMKLSVQHMRRAFQRLRVPATERATGDDDMQQFAGIFDRITNTLIEQIDTLARIANEFSSFARLPERVMEALNVNDVIREAAALMQEEAGATIALDLYDAPLVVQADREELRRIYINLIKNAIQAVPSDREGRIRIATAPDADTIDAARRVQSWVSDNGVGIPPEQRSHIFQPNFSTKTSGTGLGLAIAQKTVRELNGEIGFQTKSGEGTTFWIHLPLDE